MVEYPHPPPSRRDLMKLAATSAALTAASFWLPASSWGQPRQPGFSSNPFTLGVASGAPSVDGVVLWTRLLPQGLLARPLGPDDINLRVEIAHDEQFQQIVQQGAATAVAALAHSVHVEVAGLAPNRWYFYRFHAGDFTSSAGRTRTLPAPDAKVDKLRLAYASCQRWEHGYYSAYRHMAQEQLDMVMFLGDYIYEYAGAANAVRNVTGGWVQTLDDYRARYALHKGDADLQAAHAACPWLLCWDDHEVHNDYTGETAGFTSNNEPATSGTFVQRRASAYQAWYEHMPVRASVLTRALAGLKQGAEMRIVQNLRFGQLANLMLLDPRQYKDPIVCTRDGRLGSSTIDPATCAALNDPNRSLLGKAQETWLDEQLGVSNAGWQVLGQGTVLGPRDFKSGPQKTLWNDGWDGYPAARGRLTDSLRRNVASKAGQTAVVLGGDVHENWVGHVKADYNNHQSANVGVEFCGTGITSRNNNAARNVVDGWLAENPHFSFADNQAKGYGVCEFTPSKLTTTLRAVDDATRRDATVATLASFEVKAGKAAVERV
jgi:alkaline phosphatase D